MGQEEVSLKQECLGKIISVTLHFIGSDLNVMIAGGDKEHIGSVSIALPRESISGEGKSATVSTYVYSGHKDDVIGNEFAKVLSAKLQCKVVVCCGIHYDNIDKDRLEIIVNTCNELLINVQRRL
jgi:gallate decarboxylase subunit D